MWGVESLPMPDPYQVIELPDIISAQDLLAIIYSWRERNVQSEDLRIAAGTYLNLDTVGAISARINAGDRIFGVLAV